MEVGQVIERPPPPENGHLVTFVLLKGTHRPARVEPTGAMLRRRLAPASAEADVDDRRTAKAEVSDECARILNRGMRQQLRDAASAYLAHMDATIPTLEEATRGAAIGWVAAARSALAGGSPADEAATALHAPAGNPTVRRSG